MSLSDAHYFEEMSVKKYEEIRKLLDSREKKDKLEGMKRLLAMISIGRDASDFFPVLFACTAVGGRDVGCPCDEAGELQRKGKQNSSCLSVLLQAF